MTGENHTGAAKRGTAKLHGKALTLAIIKAMQPGDELADPEHPGLRVRCKAVGTGKQQVFFYRYRNSAGALRQVEVGVLGPMPLALIRSRWQELKDSVRNGTDPREELKAAKAKAVTKQRAAKVKQLTVGDVVEQYLAESVEPSRKAKGADETRRLLAQLIRFASWVTDQKARNTAAWQRRRGKLPKELEDVADLPAVEFNLQRAHELLLAFGTGAPRSGGMVRQELRAAWDHAIGSGRLPGPNPFAKQGKKDKLGGAALVANSKRERVLSKEEAGLLLRWMAEPRTFSRTVRDALELVLRTGLRSGEVCEIHSRELERRDGVLWLNIPGGRMKGKADHSVPLVGRAEQIVLARMPDQAGYLFPDKTGKAPLKQKVLGVEVYCCSGRSKAKAYAARRVCPVADWAPHDLRRTARTFLGESGCPYEVGESILAHTIPGVGGIYNKARYEAGKIEWLTKLGEELDRLAVGRTPLALVGATA